jgi:DNA-binding transcriptional LysR family regulator
MKTIEGRFEQALSFAEVAEAGSFTAAAERLGRSKAHLSKQVAQLEQALGVQLLFRTTRKLTLTDTGRLYLDYCRQLRETLLESERAVSATREEAAGTLRVTAPTSFGDAFLLDLLIDFRAAQPQLQVEVDLCTQRRDLIADGYDFAIRATRTLEDHLVARALGVIRDLPVASPTLIARHAMPQLPADLAALPAILNSHFRDDPEWVLLRGGDAQAVRVGGNFSVNHFGMIRSAAIKGLGIARLPHYLVADALADGRLVRLLPDWEFAPTPVYLVHPQRRHQPYRNRVFAEFVRDWLADPGKSAVLR